MDLRQSDARPEEQTLSLGRDIRTPGAFQYLVNYILLGAATVMLTLEIVQTGVWRKLWLPIFLITLAMANLPRLQSRQNA